MKSLSLKLFLMLVVGLFVLSLNDEITQPVGKELLSTAEAVLGRPATPVSYAGVARRSPVGVNRAGNRGGPVNRVGRR